MLRKLVTATVSAALCASMMMPAVAAAQEYRFAGFDAPRGATATLNVRVPMGREHRERASYGLTFGYGQTLAAPGMTGETRSRAVNLADLRFSGTELRNARVASFDLANLDRDRRASNLTGGGNTLWIVVAVAAAATVCFVITDCFGGDDDESN